MHHPAKHRKDPIEWKLEGFDLSSGLPLRSPVLSEDEPTYDSDGFVPEDERDGG